MMDLFTLGMAVDTAPLKKGRDELGKFGKAAEGAKNSVDKYGNKLTQAYKEMGRFIDRSGRMREANGRFVKGLEKTSEGLKDNTKKSNEFSGSMRAATSAITAFLSVAGAIQGLRIADQYQLMNDRIRLATEETGDFVSVQAELFEISQQTGTGLQNNVELFDRIRIGAQELGRSNKEVLQLVEAIDQLGASGGTSQEALGNATLQLSQALAGGVLRAEEFNSVVENTPKIAQAIAEGLNTSIGGLRQMVLDGGVLADDVFEALLSQSDKIADNFEQMPIRMGRATTSFSNSITKLLGELDEVSGVSSAVATSINDISESIDVFTSNQEDLEDTVEAITMIGTAALGAAGAYATYTAGAYAARVATLALTASMATNPVTLAILAFGAAGGAIYAYSENADTAATNTNSLADETENLRMQVVALEHAYKGLSREQLFAEEARLENQRKGLEANLAEQLELAGNSPIELPSLEIARNMLEANKQALAGVTAELAKYKKVRGEVSKDEESVQLGGFDIAPAEESLSGSLDLNEYRSKIDSLSTAFAPAVTEMQRLKAAQAEITDLMQIAGAEDMKTLREALKNVNAQIDELTSAELEGMFTDLGDSLAQSLASGDFSALQNSLSSAISQAAGAALGGGFLGALGGGLAGGVISGLLAGKKQTGSSTSVSLSGGTASGSNKTNYSSLFGSSSKTTALGSDVTKALNNSLSMSLSAADRSLSLLAGGLVVSVDDFSKTVKVSEGDLSGAIDSLTDSYVSANVAYIEDFQRVNETALSALERLSAILSSVQDSFSIVSGSALESAAQSYIDSQAASLEATYSAQVSSMQAAKAQAQANLAEAREIYNINYEGDNVSERKQAASLALAAAGLRSLEYYENYINTLTADITETTARLGQSAAQASTEFSNAVIDALASIESIDTDSATTLLSQLASSYEENFYSLTERVSRATERAQEELEQFSDLGIDSTTSLSEFRKSFEAFVSSDAFTPEGYAKWLSAADALEELNSVVDDIDSSGALNSITDFVLDLMGLSADGTQTLASAKAAYESALSAASAGDDEALSKLTTLADAYLGIAKTSVATAADLAGIRAGVIGGLTGLTGTIPAYANGTDYHQGGWAMVGERGAELVNLPTGSSVTTASNTAKMLDNSNLLDAVNQLINIMSEGQYKIAKASQDSYKILNGWNKIGLPAERVL